MVTEKKVWYEPLYSKLKHLGVKTDPIAARIGVSRTAVRLWFDSNILDERRAALVADALEDFAQDVTKVARELRKGFREDATS